MPVQMFANNLPNPEERDRVSATLCEALRDLPGNWELSILAAQDNDAWEVRIQGARGFNWVRKFYYEEHNPAFIAGEVRSALSNSPR